MWFRGSWGGLKLFDFKAINIESVFNWIVTLFGVGSFGYLIKSRKQKKAEDDNSTANSIKEWAEAFKLVTNPLNERIGRLETHSESQQKQIVELSIQVGVLTKENDRKDQRIKELETENSRLMTRLLELEAA